MLTPISTDAFKKGRKQVQKRGRDINRLTEVMALLIDEQPLPPKHRNHPLRGKWNGCLECHIEPDWLLIYEINKAAREIIFHRTGTHSDLF